VRNGRDGGSERDDAAQSTDIEHDRDGMNVLALNRARMLFVPSITPPSDTHDAAWIYFHGSDVLVDEVGVLLAAPERLGLSPMRTVYLGTLDCRPCFAAELPQAGVGARFVSLRTAFMTLAHDLLGVLSAAAERVHFEQLHRFCARCGSPLSAHDADRARRCNACGADYYPHIAPAVIVLVHDRSRIQLTHSGNRPFWALVAGFLEPGETLEECAAREVREETGISIDGIRYFGSQVWPFPSQVMIGFDARYAGGDIVVDRTELDEARWFEQDVLPPVPPKLSIARKLIDAHLARALSRVSPFMRAVGRGIRRSIS
jgi:NAD+ diphosphatase